MAQRVVRLLQDSKGETYRVLALTYNNRAAASMRRRVRERLGEHSWRATIETYHAFYLDILRHYGAAVGVPPEVTVYDTTDARIQALAQGLEDEGFVLSGDELDRAGAVELLDQISRLKRALVPPAASPDRRVSGGLSLREAYTAYEAVLRRNGAVDFDGMLTRAYELLTDHPQVAKHYRRIYGFIMVDEAQDTSTIQFELLRALCGDEHRNVFMVADPDQLINRWLGADRKNLDRFRKDFGAREYHLTTNFRCADSIVAIANRLLESEEDRARAVSPSGNAAGWVGAASFPNEPAEARAVVDWVCGLQEYGLRSEWVAIGEQTQLRAEEIAVLGRSRLQLEPVLTEFDRRGEAYTFRSGDVGPFDSDLYSTVLDSLRVLANPRDVAMRRTLLAELRLAEAASPSPIDDLAAQEASAFLTSVGQMQGGSLGDVLAKVGSAADIREAMSALMASVSEEEQEGDLGEIVRADRLLLVDRLERYKLAHESRKWSWSGVVRSLVDEPRADPGGYRVSTVHAAKGLEFRAVVVVGLNEGSFPDFRSTGAPEEESSERRLAYVAVTRAARALLLTRPRSRVTRYGNVRLQTASQFLTEMQVAMEDR